MATDVTVSSLYVSRNLLSVLPIVLTFMNGTFFNDELDPTSDTMYQFLTGICGRRRLFAPALDDDHFLVRCSKESHPLPVSSQNEAALADDITSHFHRPFTMHLNILLLPVCVMWMFVVCHRPVGFSFTLLLL